MSPKPAHSFQVSWSNPTFVAIGSPTVCTYCRPEIGGVPGPLLVAGGEGPQPRLDTSAPLQQNRGIRHRSLRSATAISTEPGSAQLDQPRGRALVEIDQVGAGAQKVAGKT